MSDTTLLKSFDLLATAHGGVARLRELVLGAALRGKLDASGRPELQGGVTKGNINALLHEFPIPGLWKWCKVGDLCELRTGATPSRAKKEYFGGDIPWLVSGDIHKQEIVECEGRITTEGMANSNCKILPIDSVLIALNGQGKTRATVAILRFPAACNQSLVAMTPKPGAGLLPEFLFWNLRYRYREIRHITGDKQRRGLNMGLVSRLSIVVPSIDEQRSIVARIDELMKLCDILEKQGRLANEQHTRLTAALFEALAASETAQALAENWKLVTEHFDLLLDRPEAVGALEQTILQLAVRGLLVPQDPQDEPASELLKKIRLEKDRLIAEGEIKRDNPLPPIAEEETPFALPVGWEWARFGDASINRDGERIPVSSSDRDSRAKVYDYYGASGVIDKIDGFLFDKTLLLIGEDGANLINRSTPIAFLAHGKYWVNNHAHVIDTTHPQLMTYLALFINAISLEPYVTGTAQPKMNQAKLNSIVVALPPLAEQSRIVTRVESLRRLCADLRKSLTASQSTQSKLAESLVAEIV